MPKDTISVVVMLNVAEMCIHSFTSLHYPCNAHSVVSSEVRFHTLIIVVE